MQAVESENELKISNCCWSQASCSTVPDYAKVPSCLMSNVAATCLSSVAAGNDQSCQLNFAIVFTILLKLHTGV